MELLVRKRTPLRTTFTKQFKALTDIFQNENVIADDFQTKYNSFQRIYSELFKIDNEILDLLLNDKDEIERYSVEFDAIEEYREKFDIIKTRVESFSVHVGTQRNSAASCSNSKLKLPKIELIKFSGEVKDWLSFWSQFKRIHDNTYMDLEDKFQYLIQCMIPGSRAKEIIDSYPPTADNYVKAVDSLKTRFGREELLIEFYVRELLGLVVKNAINVKSKVDITQLYDKLESHLRSLESIGMTSDKYAAMLFPLVESCIPEDILRVWLRNPAINKAETTYGDRLSQLLLFLRAEVEGEERISLAKTGIKQNNSSFKMKKCREIELLTPTANELYSSTKQSTKLFCVFCEKSHQSKDCFQGQKLPLEERINILKNKRCCLSCLKIGHKSKYCRSNVQCMLCGKKHFIILCPDFKSKSNSKVPVLPTNNGETENNSLSSISQSEEVLLQTLSVGIDVGGTFRAVRALIDTGSQRSYVLQSTVKELQLKPMGYETLNHVVFGGNTSRKEHRRYNLRICGFRSSYTCEIDVLDQPTICGSIPRVQNRICLRELREKGIIISDVGKDRPQIELLIGADFAGELYTGQIHRLKSGLTAVETRLGWVLMGKETESFKRNSTADIVTSLLIQSNNITDLWKLETLGITDPCETQSKEEMEAVVTEYFKQTICVNKDGRYEVSLPWMHNREDLQTNKEIAEMRLKNTTSKLMNEGKFANYNDVLNNWLEDNIIIESSTSDGHFLPHRGVFKSHTTTPVRPVFDASCKKKGQLCLNDCLSKGPNLLELIPSILFKFREKNIGVISDIKKAFLQIAVNPHDQNYLKFLWWKDETCQDLKILQHCRLVFGLNCSPYLLSAVINHHLDQYTSSEYHKVTENLKSAFYVDNCVTSLDSETELKEFIEISTKVMAEAKFDLRGWEYSKLAPGSAILGPSPVLGVLWDRDQDLLYCDTSQITRPEGPITRRSILSLAQRVFDPLGIACPVTLYPKILLQNSWKSKLSWDAEVPEDISKSFLKWVDDLKILHKIKISRHAFLNNASHLSLHIFTDASANSYAAVVYLRCETSQNTSIQLIMAKSRVAPLRKISIPRMELLACGIGARLADFVKRNMKEYNFSEYYWTDSSTVLYWIRHNEPWAVFVQNRVNEIRRLTNLEYWRHVPGQLNPADLPSRGCTVNKLIETRWWEGPTWLKLKEEEWPQSDVLVKENEIFHERKKTSVILVNEIQDSWLVSYFSSYNKIVRMVGWILRFFHNAKNLSERKAGNLTTSELTEAENRILRIVQVESFTPNNLEGFKSLSVFTDEKGILRVRTKLTERKDQHNFKYPVLLPGKHKLTELLIRYTHRKNLHAGQHILMSMLRERYWIVGGRRALRRVISDCIKCKRFKAKPLETDPVPLPEDRVRDAGVFEVIGVDLAGPLVLRGGTKS